MSVALFVIEFVFVFVATLAVLHFYGDLRNTHFLVTLAVFASWFFSFLIIFILPMDVTNTLYQDCLRRYSTNNSDWSVFNNNTEHFYWAISNNNNNGTLHNNATTTSRPPTTFLPVNTTSRPVNTTSLPINTTSLPVHTTSSPVHKCIKPWSHMPVVVLPDLWKIIYWSSLLLSWVFLPIMQSYVYAGDFTVWGKFKTAIYENSLWYASYLIIFGGLLIYVAVDPALILDTSTLTLICITASNTWGLLLLVLLLGYGLVDLPRNIWNMSLPNLRLENAFFKVAKLTTEKEDAFEELSRLLSEVKKASEEIKYNNKLRKHLDIIVGKCPSGSETIFSKGTEDYIDYVATEESTTMFTTKELIKLHKGIIVMSHRAARAQFQWNDALRLTFYLEDVLKAELNKDRVFIPSFTEHNRASKSVMTLQWYWQVVFRRWMLRLLALVLLIFSISLVWSEVTFFSSNPTLSLFAIFIDLTNKGFMFFSIEVGCCFTIAYMCMCTYYTVFKMKFFNYYYFASNHQTDSYTLLFSGLFLCRLTYALCLNFLAMIHMDGHITGQTDQQARSETDFTRFMGHLDLLSFISKGLNIYYPMIVLLVCFCTYFSLGKRLLHCCGVDQFIIDDDFSADLVHEGKEIAKRERRKLERQINGTTDWSERSKDMRNKYSRFGRKNDVEKIDDSNDNAGGVDSPPNVNVKTRLGAEGVKKYTIGTNDKLDLLGNVEYEPTESPPSSRSTRRYDNIGGTSTSSVPRNIFDDA